MSDGTKDAHWERVDLGKRMLHVMERLVNKYHYPVNGAAGIVGNLVAESGVIPNRVEGSAESTPMRSRNFNGAVVDHTPEAIMDRSQARRIGPALPGIGLAQWTSGQRRAGVFQHPFEGHAHGLGAAAVFDMDDQIDFLNTELTKNYPGVSATVRNPKVGVNDACDEIAYDYETPGAVLQGGHKLPRSNPRVQKVFATRRPFAQRALSAYRAAHP